MRVAGSETNSDRRSLALRFVLMIGVVSFFADFVYEGGWSIGGSFLATLGASGAVVGIVAGLGELLGYGLRFFSGRVSERTRHYQRRRHASRNRHRRKRDSTLAAMRQNQRQRQRPQQRARLMGLTVFWGNPGDLG
jgi:hypothetical protein